MLNRGKCFFLRKLRSKVSGVCYTPLPGHWESVRKSWTGEVKVDLGFYAPSSVVNDVCVAYMLQLILTLILTASASCVQTFDLSLKLKPLDKFV
jgi:hypothetical protein